MAVIGGLIGFVIAATLFWYLFSHRTYLNGQTPSQRGEHVSSFRVNFEGMATPTAVNYVYRVVGSPGTSVVVNYAKPDGSNVRVRVTLPWSIAVSNSAITPARRSLFFVDAISTSRGRVVELTCQNFVHDVQVSQETDKGSNASVVCSGF